MDFFYCLNGNFIPSFRGFFREFVHVCDLPNTNFIEFSIKLVFGSGSIKY